ncbi:MAG: VanZ family protein [Candidatus Omnitrophota bacterium]|nr:VanZ family protein [Candidatus Omnitrophota bacterium]
MMMSDKIALRKKYWLWAAGWVALIYSTLSVVRPVCEFLKKTTPFNAMMNGVLIVCLCLLLKRAWGSRWIRRASTWGLLLGAVAVYAVLALRLPSPEERLHFLEYGVLAFLIYRALRLDVSSSGAYMLAFILTSLLGWGDEGIQGILPNRYFQWADVWLNSQSALLGLWLTYILQRNNNERQQLEK